MQIRPTLVIGIGGSGTYVVRRLRKRLSRSLGSSISPALQLLAFDTDEQQGSAELSVLQKNEFYLLNNFLADSVISTHNLPLHPNIQRWWRYEQLLPGFIRDGAQQRPPVGRLALFYHAKTVWNAMQTAVRTMFTSTPEYQPVVHNAIDLYVIGSCCGGTGAGMFFDITAMAKQAVINSGGRDPLTNGCVFLPSCFHGVVNNETGLYANSHIFLRTLEYFQRLEWPDTPYGMTANETFHAGPIAMPLLKRIHLVSAVNVEGVVSAELQTMYEKVAMLIDLEVTSAAARAFQSALINVPPNWTSTAEGKLTGYSSFGVAQLAAASDYTRLTLLPRVSDRLLRALMSPSKANADTAVLSRNEAFARLENIFATDNNALDEASGYEFERQKLATASSRAEVQNVVSRIDTLINSVAIDWVSRLGSLEQEIDAAWTEAFKSGLGGHSLADSTLRVIENQLSDVIKRAKSLRGTERERVDGIVKKVDGWLVSEKKVQAVVARDVLPYLRDQTILGVRQKLANAALGPLQTVHASVQSRLRALHQFAEGADAVASSLRAESDKQLSAMATAVGAGNISAATTEIASAASEREQEMVDAALHQATTDGTLARLARTISGTNSRQDVSSAIWGVVDVSVSHQLAQKAIVPSDWVGKAVDSIVNCQPMVNLQGRGYAREAVARMFRKDDVEAVLKSQHPELTTVCTEANEPGQLDAMTAVLNFPLFQLHELREIENGFKQFKRLQTERIENRCALGNRSISRQIFEIELQPLVPEQKALARVLAEMTGRVRKTAQDYIIDDHALGTDPDSSWSDKRRELDAHLVSRGVSDKLLSEWRHKDEAEAKIMMQDAAAKWGTLVAEAKARAANDSAGDDWEYYVDMLSNELDAIQLALRRM
jgi:hypothetical protein